MRAGELRVKIDIQRATATLNDFGQPEETWTTLLANIPASFSPAQGDERFVAEQLLAKEQFEFRVRWSTTLSEVSPTDRVIYPSGSGGIYDVTAVAEIGRREGLSIMAMRNVGVPIA